MQCEDDEMGVPNPCRSRCQLDTALSELGMLATTTRSREEYLAEIQNKKSLNMLTINTRYVSNVSIGFRVRPVAPHVRYKPYRPPKERHRTRSENNDNDAMTLVQDIVEDCVESTLEIKQLKKSKSLESIIAENSEDGDTKAFKLGIEKLSEVEFVSNSIQNLKVVE